MTDTAQDAYDLLVEEVERWERDVERAANQHDPPDCPHCGREMSAGRVGGGEMTWGCYPSDLGGDHDCPYYEEHGYSYSKDVTLKDVNAMKRALVALESVKWKMGRELEVGDTDD